jgi:hypothetical protein
MWTSGKNIPEDWDIGGRSEGRRLCEARAVSEEQEVGGCDSDMTTECPRTAVTKDHRVLLKQEL